MFMKCKPGCTCKRHNRVLTEEHRTNIAKANSARRGESRKCPDGCTCNRHKAYYRGGSKKGRTFSDQAKANMTASARNRAYTPEGIQSLSDRMKENHQDPDFTARRISALKDYWANVVSPEDLARGVKRSSKAEKAIAPFLESMGYHHNEGVGQLRIGRRTPDFIDAENRRVFEYFGVYWHPDPQEALDLVDFYASRGWWATVLWEDRVLRWIEDHKGLVDEECYESARHSLANLHRYHPGRPPDLFPRVIYQHEWDDPRVRTIISSQSRYAENKTTNRIGARLCEIDTKVSSTEAARFLDENHLQGRAGGSVRLGLRHDSELVALMSFGVPRMQKKSAPVEWEMIRYAVRLDHAVPGGASRLFKEFVRTTNPSSIVSYSDNAKSSGKLYETLGFSLSNETAPDYVWWDGKIVKKRYECMSYKLKKKYPNLPGIDLMSESQIMSGLGYRKISDLGKKVWVWNKIDL